MCDMITRTILNQPLGVLYSLHCLRGTTINIEIRVYVCVINEWKNHNSFITIKHRTTNTPHYMHVFQVNKGFYSILTFHFAIFKFIESLRNIMQDHNY